MINQYALYGFYLGILLVSGAGEYFHIVPPGTFATILGGVFGHNVAYVQMKGIIDVRRTEQSL